MLDCDAVLRQLWDFLDGELPESRLREIEAHVKLCDMCGPHVSFERTFKAAVRAAHAAEVPAAALGERIRSALRSAGFEDPR